VVLFATDLNTARLQGASKYALRGDPLQTTGFAIHRALTVVAVICIGWTAVLTTLNASRFCFREERILDDGTFLRMVARNFVEIIIEHSEQHWRTLLRTNYSDGNYSNPSVIRYKNVDEFYEKNPNCCQIERFDGPQEPIFIVRKAEPDF
jgi:hypothetical protein